MLDNKIMKSLKNKLNKKKINRTFSITVILVVALHFLRPYLGLDGVEFLETGGLFLYAFVTLFVVNIIAFSIPLLKTLIHSQQIRKEPTSEEEKEKKFEEVMVPALEGRTPPPEQVLKILQVFVSICLGLIVGSLSAWFIEVIISKFF